MDTFKAIATVLAVRKFKDAPVPQDVVREIVEAGRLTASSINGQPWHFVVVQDKNTLQQLGRSQRLVPTSRRRRSRLWSACCKAASPSPIAAARFRT